MGSSRWAVSILAVALAGWSVSLCKAEPEAAAPTPGTVFADMMQTADAFIASLDPQQRSQALFEFDDAERFNWHFVPRLRRGLSLKDMSPQQQTLARGILQAGLSQRGYLTASTIIGA